LDKRSTGFGSNGILNLGKQIEQFLVSVRRLYCKIQAKASQSQTGSKLRGQWFGIEVALTLAAWLTRNKVTRS
jgi:hypothetical protein